MWLAEVLVYRECCSLAFLVAEEDLRYMQCQIRTVCNDAKSACELGAKVAAHSVFSPFFLLQLQIHLLGQLHFDSNAWPLLHGIN